MAFSCFFGGVFEGVVGGKSRKLSENEETEILITLFILNYETSLETARGEK